MIKNKPSTLTSTLITRVRSMSREGLGTLQGKLMIKGKPSMLTLSGNLSLDLPSTEVEINPMSRQSHKWGDMSPKVK